MPLAGSSTKIIDLKGRRVLPGLIDNHLHIIRGGLNFNMELRWDGVRSLADAMDMLKRQVAITPPPQWVRVVGGFTEHQFAEKRLPTIDELNAVAPETPVFLLHLYDRAILNGAALRAVGYTKDTPEPPGGEIVRDARGNPTGLLLAKPNAQILYATLAKGPEAAVRLSAQFHAAFHARTEPARRHRRDRCRRRLPELSGGLRRHPEARRRGPTHHSPRLQSVHAKAEGREGGFPELDQDLEIQAGQRLLPAQRRWRDAGVLGRRFRGFPPAAPRHAGTRWKANSKGSCASSSQNRWPWRLHATYDETISRALDVFERVNQDIPLEGLNWFFDHAETISDQSIDRIAALGGGIAVQHRMAYQGEYFVERYGFGAAEATPPVAKIIAKGVKVSAGTDATRVASYNPWVSLAWLVTGKTVGGLRIYSAAQLPRPRDSAADVDRERHLVLERGGQERPDPGRSTGGPDRARPRLLLLRRSRDRRHDVRSDGGRWQDRLRGGRFQVFRQHRSATCDARLVAGAYLRRLCGLGRREDCRHNRRSHGKNGMSCGCANRAKSMVTITRRLGRASCRSLISRVSGARSAAPAGRCDMKDSHSIAESPRAPRRTFARRPSPTSPPFSPPFYSAEHNSPGVRKMRTIKIFAAAAHSREPRRRLLAKDKPRRPPWRSARNTIRPTFTSRPKI